MRRGALLLGVIALSLSGAATTAAAADRFDVYPSAESACTVFAREISRLIADTNALRGRPVTVRLAGATEHDECQRRRNDPGVHPPSLAHGPHRHSGAAPTDPAMR